MKKIFFSLLVFVSCSASRPPIIIFTAPQPPVIDKDWSPIFQKGIDSCIANNIPEYFIPAGRFICREPLILSKWSAANGYYVPFSLTIFGTSTFAGADGSGTILDFSSMTSGFGVGIQGGKGVEIKRIKLIGAFNYKLKNAYSFYNSTLQNFTDGVCRDSQYSPYSAIVIDPFGPSVPKDGGFPGKDAYGNSFKTYYRGQRNGSTGTVIEDCYLTNWVIGLITSPNGITQNAELVLADKIQFGNMKICVAGCQDQEKMNRVSNVMEWGVVHTCFATGIYGAGSVGNWYIDHWNIAGYTNQIAYNNQSGYFPSYFSDIYAESVGRIGPIYTANGTTFSNSTINFATILETGSYTDGMISGYGVTFIGCQLRLYGQYSPITILTGAGSNQIHFRDCGFDVVPFYPQTYPYGYSDFSNCAVGNVYNILNPIGPQTARWDLDSSMLGYTFNSNVAAKCVPVDAQTHKLPGIISSTGVVVVNEPIVGTYNGVDYKIVGVVTAKTNTGFVISYMPASIDSTKKYSLYHWKTILKK